MVSNPGTSVRLPGILLRLPLWTSSGGGPGLVRQFRTSGVGVSETRTFGFLASSCFLMAAVLLEGRASDSFGFESSVGGAFSVGFLAFDLPFTTFETFAAGFRDSTNEVAFSTLPSDGFCAASATIRLSPLVALLDCGTSDADKCALDFLIENSFDVAGSERLSFWDLLTLRCARVDFAVFDATEDLTLVRAAVDLTLRIAFADSIGASAAFRSHCESGVDFINSNWDA